MSASREKKKRQDQVNTEVVSAPQTKKGMSKGLKKVLYAIVALVLVAAIVFLGMVSSGFFTTHTTAATVNGHKLTPAMVNYHYGAAYQEMASLLGYMADPEVPLSEQAYMTEDYETWHDYLLDYALNSAATTYAIYDEAMANGYTLSENAAATLETESQMLQMYAGMSGFTSVDAYVAATYGTGCDLDSYLEYANIAYTAQEYATHIYSSQEFTQAELDAYYAENPGNFDSVSYYQFHLTTEPAEGEETVSDDALAALEETAKAMAEESKGNEAKFLELCAQNNDAEGFDPASTLMEDVAENNLSETVRAWLADDARQNGDTAYFANNTNGFFVLFFVEQVDHSYLLPNVRHILIGVDAEADDAAKAEAKAKAEELLSEFEAGEKTEDAFATLATANTEDTGSAANGGLYENITRGAMVTEFEDWCYDEARQTGDTGIVETSYGYHVMYFSGYGDTCHDYLVETEMVNNAYTEWQTKVSADLTWVLLNDKYVTAR